MFHYNTTIWWTIVWLVWLQQPNKLWGKIQKPLIQHGHHHNYHEHDEHKHQDHDQYHHHHYHQHYQPNHHRKHSHSKHHQHYESSEYELVKSTTVATDATRVNPLMGGLHSIANINTFENNELSMLLLPSSHQRHQQQEEEENKLMAATATATASTIFQITSKPLNQSQMNTSKKPTRVIPKTNLLGEIVNFHISTDKKPLLTPWLQPSTSSSASPSPSPLPSPSSSSTTVPDTVEEKNAEHIISTDSGYDQSQGQQIPHVKEKHFNSNSNSNSNKASTPFSMRHNKFNLNAMTAHHHYRRQHHHVEQFAEEQIDYGGDEQDQEPDSDYYYDEYAYGQDSDEVASSSMKTATDNKHRDHDQHADNDDDNNNNDNITGNNHSHFGILNEDNLSDRSYTRITRSRLDEDYADDEPYHNTIIDELQRDDTPGLITEQKYSEVGNEKAVQQARDRYIQQENNKRPRTPHELATDHWHRMIAATKCRKPMPRVIPVSNNTSKRYEPYATILHRCGEDTGCCGSTASVCTVKRYEVVMVYVFSYDFNYRKEIEALPMHNHTECHCVNRGSLIHDSSPRGKRSGQHRHLLQPKQPQLEKRWRYSDMLSRLQHSQQTQHRDRVISCPCPHHFHYHEEDMERHVSLPRPHTVFTRKCRCDCLANDSICERYKRGEESFPSGDRKCIAERNCKPPICSFGNYNSELGKCPAVHESMVDSFSRSPYQLQQQSHRHLPTNQERHLIKLDLN